MFRSIRVLNDKEVKFLNELIEIHEGLFKPRCMNNINERVIDESLPPYENISQDDMPETLKNVLIGMAPELNDYYLNEVGINRYKIGNGISKHVDRHIYRANLIVPLQTSNDGLTIYTLDNPPKEYFVKDEAGIGILMENVLLPHEVKPVNQERITLNYLFL